MIDFDRHPLDAIYAYIGSPNEDKGCNHLNDLLIDQINQLNKETKPMKYNIEINITESEPESVTSPMNPLDKLK